MPGLVCSLVLFGLVLFSFVYVFACLLVLVVFHLFGLFCFVFLKALRKVLVCGVFGPTCTEQLAQSKLHRAICIVSSEQFGNSLRIARPQVLRVVSHLNGEGSG